MMIDRNTLAEKTHTLLEYPKIMETVASQAVSEEAAVILRETKPFYDTEKTEETKAAVWEILVRIKSGNDEPRSWLPSIGFLLPKIATQGAVLDIDEALATGLFIERGYKIRKWIIENPENQNINYIIFSTEQHPKPASMAGKNYLYTLFNHSPSENPDQPDLPCKKAAAEIFKIIDREGKLRDLPVLRAIRKRIVSLERELKTAVSRYSSDDDYKRMLQSPLPSQRDGRTVLAVKANFRGRIRGIVHEVSSSGQTVFIEPLDVVDKNNEILLEKRNLDVEIQKIFRELTEKVSIFAEDIKMFHNAIIQFECLRARAKYSISIKGHFANKTTAGDLALVKARHPLLKKAVPIDIEMKSTTRTLIITGPNTGGKTVALKTLGLFALMNQSGLALPLDEGSSLPVFDGIYADIGDEQSINQSLSTFSGHISNISAIRSCATENSLVLLDELGSGTDPEEGGAIAMAVLDYLIVKNSRMIITTHHGVLKNYGYTRQGVENASVEFDVKTLSPTYKIINGVPGESRALDIASANGLDNGIVERARKYIEGEKSDISALISGLEKKHRELAGIEQKSVIEQNRLKEEKRKADLKELRLRQKEAELKRETSGKLHHLLMESRKTLENLVRELKEGEIDREKTLKVKKFISELADNVETESAVLDEEENAIREQLNKIETGEISRSGFFPGMEVFAGPSKQRGVILRQDKKSNSWIIKTGSLKVSFSETELIPASSKQYNEKTCHSVTRNDVSRASWAVELASSTQVVYELKLLGMKLEEAVDALRRQIEAASLAGLKTFAVIHGTGTGILQKGIHEYLKDDPAVEDYFFSRPEIGGFGRTEVVLK